MDETLIKQYTEFLKRISNQTFFTKSKYFTEEEVKEAFKKFGCNTTSNFSNLLDIIVEENFNGSTSHSLRKDSLGMIEYLEGVFKPK